jgi:large subunit ribosomal protein L3
MIKNIWGRKVGMTQFFSTHTGANAGIVAMPVTVIDCNGWIVTRIKRYSIDGYDAVQVGLIRQKYNKESFSPDWLKKPKHYFLYIRELLTDGVTDAYAIGDNFKIEGLFEVGQKLDVAGWSKGLGFAGVYKRHGFGGAAKSHGSMMGRRPGSIGFTRSSGEIMKGQKMAGHKGVQRTTIQNLVVVSIETSKNVLLVKGSIPGKSEALVFVKRSIKD